MNITQHQNALLITPSLLNAWLYIYEVSNNVKETENDAICLEDKQELAMQKAKDDFITTLKRIQTEPNQYMLEGIKFEEECYKGNTCFSEIIKNGAFQITGKKYISVDNTPFLMYGRLDVLKGGTIYDIKRVWRYKLPKYAWSCQHQFYLELFPHANKFEYLIYDGFKPHKEIYYYDNDRRIEILIKQFMQYLKENNLLEIYKENWRSK